MPNEPDHGAVSGGNGPRSVKDCSHATIAIETWKFERSTRLLFPAPGVPGGDCPRFAEERSGGEGNDPAGAASDRGDGALSCQAGEAPGQQPVLARVHSGTPHGALCTFPRLLSQSLAPFHAHLSLRRLFVFGCGSRLPPGNKAPDGAIQHLPGSW